MSNNFRKMAVLMRLPTRQDGAENRDKVYYWVVCHLPVLICIKNAVRVPKQQNK